MYVSPIDLLVQASAFLALCACASVPDGIGAARRGGAGVPAWSGCVHDVSHGRGIELLRARGHSVVHCMDRGGGALADIDKTMSVE